jgi:hypothetical protein
MNEEEWDVDMIVGPEEDNGFSEKPLDGRLVARLEHYLLLPLDRNQIP